MEQGKIPRSFGTHDGSFHADEVTACALLLLFNLIDRDKVFRTRNPAELMRCEFVCDVGGVYDPPRKLFDHHQHEYQGSLSSAGMILQYLLETGILTQKECDFFEYSLILGVDAHDNGKELHSRGVCTYSQIISNFNPIEHDAHPKLQQASFQEAMSFALSHLERMWKRYRYMQSCREVVIEAMAKEKECLMFDRNIPWLDLFFEMEGTKHPAKFIIMPSGTHWKLRGIPPTLEEKMKVRQPLPLEWAGLIDKELRQATGIKGAIFCHKGRFISVWETREDAVAALNYVLKERRRNGK